MTGREALKMVDQVCAVPQMNRADHLNVLQALRTLQEIVDRDAAPKPKLALVEKDKKAEK